MDLGCRTCTSIHWFRKGLRLHDNPSLLEACDKSQKLYPIFCLDPYFIKPDTVGVNRFNFLLESLHDLDQNLRNHGSRLYVIRGKPEVQIPLLVQEWKINFLSFEGDTEPYAVSRDTQIMNLMHQQGVTVSQHFSHTLFNPNAYIEKCGGKSKVPSTYASFGKLFDSMGSVRMPVDAPNQNRIPTISEEDSLSIKYNIPTLQELGYLEPPTAPFQGGETEALKRLSETVTQRKQWVSKFAKPETSPNSLTPSTTVLSPYLKFGCLSPALFYHTLAHIYHTTKPHTLPPVSLHGQLLWREFFYLSSFSIPHFDRMEGNPQCKQIPWERNPQMISAWKEGRTGYPYIDAIMTQLRVEGWIHHLARHSVACFLTRGDLWQHWEEGVKVFDLYLLDDDWALNNANWQWLSCSNFFYQYFRVYSPIAFGKKTDKDGAYIKKWIPKLANYPSQYIYEPWKAPAAVQKKAGCIIGIDYPDRIVDHEVISKENMSKMKDAYDDQKSNGASIKKELVSNENTSSTSKTQSKKKRVRTLDDFIIQSPEKKIK